jgi:SDR family mycofactocin-dependent oxidoreductase
MGEVGSNADVGVDSSGAGAVQGRVALVTGAARGQGRAHAIALAREGADLVLCDIGADIATVPYPLGTAADLAETVALVEAAGGRCISMVADVRDTAAMDAVVASGIEAFGAIDICVANAGIVAFSHFQDITDEMWDDMIAVDLTGTFKTMRAVVPHMIERRYGRIIATSSMAGRMGNPNLSHYVAAKWGIIGMVKTLAMELASRGVTVNAVCPAAVDTPMLQNPAMYSLFCPDLESPTRDDVVPRYQAMNRMGQAWLAPEEVSRAVLFLAADAASGMTGQVVEVSLGSAAGQH